MIYHFLMSNIVISFFILLVLATRYFLDISPRHSRSMYIMCLVLMSAVFLPNINIPIPSYVFSHKHTNASDILYVGENADLYVTSYSLDFLYYIWLTGVFVELILLIVGIWALMRIQKIPVCNKCFETLCDELCTSAKLYKSQHIKSPVSFGIFRPVVLIPETDLSDTELKFIFLHEIYHHKHKDAFINILLNILSVLYWFNPLVHIMAEHLKLDTELYCDMCVTEKSCDRMGYGKALLHMAKFRCTPVAEHFSDFKKLQKRIEIISRPKKYSAKISKTAVFVLFLVMLLSETTINAHGSIMNRVNLPDSFNTLELDSYFGDKDGCFVLFDSSDSNYYIYNPNKASKRSSPDSTYKIAIALNGLENNVISADSSTLEWDGKKNHFDEWNRSHDLFSAMHNSVNWYFQNIDSLIDNNERRNFLLRTKYGNRNTSWNTKNYWLENSLEISPFEQANFIKNVYNNSFGFGEENINVVLDSIRLSDVLYGKTGTGNAWGQNVRGWFVGAVELSDKTLFFALEITGKNADGITAQTIAVNILNDKFLK